MIDPIVSLTFAVHSNKGAYALLLGSGTSKSAGILTGWDIVLDLIKRIAVVLGEDCTNNPESWYLEKFGSEPNYSELLEKLGKTATERNSLLRSYFEPTDEEREQGWKAPKKAHEAIAELVAKGFFRVIVTTNFDKLLEKTLESNGVTPTVISTPDAAEGAMPISHEACTIIKVHGDYLDTRIKNTPSELESYDERVDILLDKIFDEYGLIICGWSAEWDIALRRALERCKSRRFTTFWTGIKEPDTFAKQLIAVRDAQFIEIKSADDFFWSLKEKVLALEQIDRTHPLSAKIAVQMVKKYLSEDRYIIELNDLVNEETERLFNALGEQNFPVRNVFPNDEEIKNRMEKYEAISEILLSMLIIGCYWGKDSHIPIWVRAIERIANSRGEQGSTVLLNFQYYPAFLLMYASGMAAIAGDKYGTLASLLTKPKIRKISEERPFVLALNTHKIIDKDNVGRALGTEAYTPLNDHLFTVMRESLRHVFPQDIKFQKCFDRFEYLYALVNGDMQEKQGLGFWFPVGRFGWGQWYGNDISIWDEIEKEVNEQGAKWCLIREGLFDGSVDRLKKVMTELKQFRSGLHWYF